VETDHACFQNATVSPYSVCYYDHVIGFTAREIVKVPGENTVSIVLDVDAPNSNPSALKIYLEGTTYLRLYDLARLLASSSRLLQAGWVSIPTRSISFDSYLYLLRIVFSYDASLDLSRKYFQLDPSSSASSAVVKYFYSSPVARLQLSSPFNNLPTVYYSTEDLSTVRALITMFKVLVLLFWLFLVAAMVLKKGAVAAECMLVLQLSYLLLLSQPELVEGRAGLQVAGKYTAGYPLALLPENYLVDLMALDLDSTLLNNCGLIYLLGSLIFLAVVGLVVGKRYAEHKAIETLALATEDNNSDRMGIAKEPSKSSTGFANPATTSDKILSYLLDIFITVLFLTVGILTVVVTFTAASTLSFNLATAILYLAIVVAGWALFFKCGDSWSFYNISFSAILKKKPKTTAERFIVGKYYIFIFGSLILMALIISFARTVGLVPLVLLVVGCIATMAVIVKVELYHEKLDRLRAYGNSVGLIGIALLGVINNRMSDSLGVGLSLGFIEFFILLSVLMANAGVLAMLAYRNWGSTAKPTVKETN
jgi:hypothetical protein